MALRSLHDRFHRHLGWLSPARNVGRFSSRSVPLRHGHWPRTELGVSSGARSTGSRWEGTAARRVLGIKERVCRRFGAHGPRARALELIGWAVTESLWLKTQSIGLELAATSYERSATYKQTQAKVVGFWLDQPFRWLCGGT